MSKRYAEEQKKKKQEKEQEQATEPKHVISV
jgi:hypothetical protein